MSQPASILDSLEGRQLGAVTFVQDYVQLEFDGPRLTAYTWPTVHAAGAAARSGCAGYRDALCAQIAKCVARAFERGRDALVVEFEDGSFVEVSLREEDRRGPEAATLSVSPQDWNVW